VGGNQGVGVKPRVPFSPLKEILVNGSILGDEMYWDGDPGKRICLLCLEPAKLDSWFKSYEKKEIFACFALFCKE
jgi:hypothetical protein